MKAPKTNKTKESDKSQIYTFLIDKNQVISYSVFTPVMIFFISALMGVNWDWLGKSEIAFLGVVAGMFLMSWFISIMFYVRGESK